MPTTKGKGQIFIYQSSQIRIRRIYGSGLEFVAAQGFRQLFKQSLLSITERLVEVGYVFNRGIEYRNNEDEYDFGDAVLLRGGIRF